MSVRNFSVPYSLPNLYYNHKNAQGQSENIIGIQEVKLQFEALIVVKILQEPHCISRNYRSALLHAMNVGKSKLILNNFQSIYIYRYLYVSERYRNSSLDIMWFLVILVF